MTITQTVEIPASRRITLEVPHEIPAGRAEVELKVIPFVKKEEKTEPHLTSLHGVETPRADALLGIFSQIGDIDLEKMRTERLEKHFK